MNNNLIKKAENLLTQCKVCTVASVSEKGYPRICVLMPLKTIYGKNSAAFLKDIFRTAAITTPNIALFILLQTKLLFISTANLNLLKYKILWRIKCLIRHRTKRN